MLVPPSRRVACPRLRNNANSASLSPLQEQSKEERMATNTATPARGETLAKRETTMLIGSDKVEGTPVFRPNGDRIGQIERVMIDKLSGKVSYAVMSFGGFMGVGEDYYPLPWSLL